MIDFVKRMQRGAVRLFVFFVFLIVQLTPLLGGGILDAQAAPAPDSQPAPAMDVGMPRPNSITVPAEINKSFTPIAIASGGISKLRVTVYNLNANPLTSATWTDNMPAGIFIANPPNMTHTCGASATVTNGAGGTLVAGDTSFMLTNGEVPEQAPSGVPGDCYVEVDVTSYTPGNLINTIPARNLSSVTDDGGTSVAISNTTPASATLNVIGVEDPSLSKAFSPNTIWAGETSTLSVTIHNNDTVSPLTHVTVTDVLPTSGDGDIALTTPLNYSLSGCGEGSGATLTDSSGGALAVGSTSIMLNDGTIAPASDCVISVDVTSGVQGNYTNTIPDGDPFQPGAIETQEGVTNQDPASAPLNVQAFTIDKAFATSPIAAGETSELTITIENHTPFDYTGAALDDVLPAGFEFIDPPAPATTNCTGTLAIATTTNTDDTLRFTGGTLPANTVCTITATARALMSTSVGTYTNTLPIGALTTTEGATNHTPASDSLDVQSISVAKNFTETDIPLGGTSLLTITISNPSPSPFTNTSLDDVLPTGLEYVTGTGSTTCVSGNVSLSSTTMSLTGATIPSGSIASPGTCVVTSTVRAISSEPPANHTNIISPTDIKTAEGGTNALESRDSINVTGIEIAKGFSPSTFAAGAETTLTITITNPAAIPFTGASLSDTLPTGPNEELYFTGTPTTTCTSGSENVSLSGSPTTRTVTLTNGTIPANGSCTITATVTTNPDAPDASYSGANANIIPANSLTTTEGASNSDPAGAPVYVENLSIDKVYDIQTISYPEVATLTITITNPATANALTGLNFTDTLPAGLIIAPAPAASTTCDDTTTPTLTATAGTDVITLSDGSIPAGLSTCEVVVPITAERTAPSDSYTNTIGAGDLGTSDPNGPTNTFETSETLDVEAVSLAKSFQFSGFEAGGTNDLTITLTNPTTEDYINVALDDILPQSPNEELYYTGTPTTTCGAGSVVIGTTNYANDTISLTGGTIPAGSPGTCTITATVTTDLTASGASYTNTIPVGALTTYVGPDLGPTNTDDATAPVYVYDETEGVTATKSFLNSTIDVFGNSRLELTFQAPPDTSLTNFSFTDNLPTGMTVSNSTAPTTSSCGTFGGAWPPVNGATTIEATGGTIAAGDTCTVRVYVTSNTGTTPGNVLTNTIYPGDISNTEDRTIPASVDADLTVVTPSTLLIDKAFYPTIVGPDGRSTLTITLENEGTTALINTSLEDIFPGTTGDGIVIASPPNASTTCVGGAVTAGAGTQNLQMTGATIPPKVGGVNGICTIVVNVQGKSTNGASPATHTNTIPVDKVEATLSGSPSTMNPQNPASANLTVKDLDLEVVKGFNPQLVYGGANSEMSIILRNPNPTAVLTEITFTDYMPIVPPTSANTAMILVDPPNFDASDCGPDAALTKIDQSTFLFTGGYLAPGDECTLTLNATMTVNGNLTNTIGVAEVTSFNGAYNHTPTSATLTNLAGASVSKSFAPNPIAAGLGSHSILTIEIRTTASVFISELGLVDNLPAGLQVADYVSDLSVPAPTTSCGHPTDPTKPSTLVANPGDTSIELSHGSLPVGFTNCFLTIPVTGAEPGEYENAIPQGSITDDQGVTNIQETKDTLTLTPYSLGNRVWYDTNNNGAVDTGEVGVENVRVELYKDDGTTPGVYDTGDTFVKFETTDADGYYRFDDLGGDDYIVVIPSTNFDEDTDTLAGYLSSGTSMDSAGLLTDSIGPDPDNDTDNEDNGVTTFDTVGTKTIDYVSSQTVTLGPDQSEPTGETDPSTNPDTADGEATDDQSNRTVDFGFYRQELGNQLFHDVVTVDGTYSVGTDQVVEGATVRLFVSDGTNDVTEIFTGADGIWGTNDDGWGPDGISGNADDGQGGMLSNASGNYRFSGLPAGNYIVKAFTPGYQSTIDTANQPDTDAPNTNVDNNDNGIGEGKVLLATDIIESNNVTLTPGVNASAPNNVVTNTDGTTYNPTVDFGLRPIVSIGSIVWQDTDRDGVQDAGEPGISGATVTLLDGTTGNPVAGVSPQTTGADGLYYFDGLTEGDYKIQVTIPDGYSPTINQTTSDNDDSENDSNIASSSGATHTSGLFTLTKDAEPDGVNSNIANSDDADNIDDNNGNMTVDFGFIKRMSIGNRVFKDDGGLTGTGILDNGIMDGDEQAFANVRVELYYDTNNNGVYDSGTDLAVLDDDNNPRFDITDADGFYLFDGLDPDDYFVHIPAGNFADDFDHDSDGGTAVLDNGALQGWYSSADWGTETEDIDPTVGGLTDKLDIDDNGVDNKYPEVNGITSGLLVLELNQEPTGEAAPQLSLEADPGSPDNEADNPTGWDGDSDLLTAGIQGSRGRNNESDDNSNLTVDFGFIPPLSLGNRVWFDDGSLSGAPHLDIDQFNDGVMNGDEAGVANVTLNLYYDVDGDGNYNEVNGGVNESAIYRTTTTDTNGYYLFDGLPEGMFKVEVDKSNFGTGGALEGYQSSTDQVAFDDESTDLNDNGEDSATYLADGIESRDFTLAYGTEPLTTVPIAETDLPDNTLDNRDAYGDDLWGRFEEKDENSNLTLDFGFVQTHSIGNRVWRDSDNSGTINGPDDANPGIGGVTVNLYAGIDNDSDGIPDDLTILATTTTGSTADDLGYYLFDNLPAGNYIVGIPASEFATTEPLEGLRSSTGTPASSTYTDPEDDNPDINDHGIDPDTQGQAVYSPIIPIADNEPSGESDLPNSTAATHTAYGDNLRGHYNETDLTSDLTVDFGFFGGTDVPFSIGNHLWYDDGGTGSGIINNGVRDGDEASVAGARVELYRDGNGNGQPDTIEYMSYDTTDSGGFYLFDNLDPGDYIVIVDATNFQDGGVLAGWYSSQSPVPTNANADIDNNDDGIDVNRPEDVGVQSTIVTLIRGTNEPTNETFLSNDSSTASGFNPTAGDGSGHIGRFGETDATSNVTVDFGFIPPMSIGNRVWIDDGTNGTGGVVLGEYNDGVMSAAESTNNGVANVTVQLYKDGSPLYSTQTDANGYYLFDRVQPDANYVVKIDEANFVSGGALYQYVSSFDNGATPTDDDVDIHDDGIDDAAPATNGILSPEFAMAYGSEPSNESDLPNTNNRLHADNVGAYGQTETNSNLSLDFGFVQPRSLGNRVWFDTNNDGILNNGEQPVPDGVAISLYLDADGNGVPDGAALRTDTTKNGYYLFDNLAQTGYIVGVDASNFGSTKPLYGYYSSTDDSTNGVVDNDTNNIDSLDNGIDSTSLNPGGEPYGILSTTIDLSATSNYPENETVSGEADPDGDPNTPNLGNVPQTEWDGENSIGRYGELDQYSDLTIDFGFYKVEIGNLVYLDKNANGNYDDAVTDEPISGATVKLYKDDGTGTFIYTGLSVTTGADGKYIFPNLPAGDYIVKVTTPDGMVSTIDSYDQDDNNDPDNPPNDGTDNNDNGIGTGPTTKAGTEVPSGVLTMSGGEGDDIDITPSAVVYYDYDTGITTDLTVDFGFTYAYALGNRVWFDTDNGSDIDAGEIGIDGVAVELYLADALGKPTGSALYTTTTGSGDEAGYYLFDYLTADEYVVVIPASNFSGVLKGYWSSATEMLATGTLSETRATGDTDNQTDLDDNGLLDSVSGDVVSVAIAVGPTGLTEPDTDDDLRVGTTEDSTQPDGRSELSVDFGFYKTEIGNIVYNDIDKNGNYEGIATHPTNPDILLNGITVQLFNSDGTEEIKVGPDGILGTSDDATGVVTTGANSWGDGVYSFSGLPEGAYIIKIGGKANYTSTIDSYANDTYGQDDTADPDENVDNNDNGIGTDSGQVASAQITMDAAETATNITVDNNTGTTTDLTVDFGVLNRYALGNRVWFDTNNNAEIDAGEVGVDDVTVYLYKDDGSGTFVDTGLTTLTDNGGYYLFDYLNAGDYQVVIPAAEFASGGDLEGYYSSQTAMNAGGVISETLADPANDNDDKDDNGTLVIAVGDPLEGAIISQTLTLGPIGSDEPENETDVDGSAPGNDNQGEQDDNRANMTVDFGFYQLEVGDIVYLDNNIDGTYDAGDVLLNGVTVELYNAITNTLVESTATAHITTDGEYLFSDLPDGNYYVQIETPSGYVSTIDTASPTDTATNPDLGIDNNDNGIGIGIATKDTIKTANFTLNGGEGDDVTVTPDAVITYKNADGTTTDTSIDLGLTYTYALGNRVWYDTNNSATIDNGEGLNGATKIGVDGVRVELYAADTSGNPTGSLLEYTTTANGGYYLFNYLTAGDYIVVLPEDNFRTVASDQVPLNPLAGYWSSTTQMQANGTLTENVAPDPDLGSDGVAGGTDDDTDSDDNGTLETTSGATFEGAVLSKAVTLGTAVDSEPTNDDDLDATLTDSDKQGQIDSRANMTVDFGFYKTEIGNLVFGDVNKDGDYDSGTDTLLQNITVRIFSSDGTEILVGPDGIYGTADDASGDVLTDVQTNASGIYNFSGLPQGNYIVKATTPAGALSTKDDNPQNDNDNPNLNIDDNDNGVGQTSGDSNRLVSAGVLTMTPGSTGAQNNNTVTDSSGTTSDTTVDFGFTTVYALGNRVWFDTNNSATMNNGEGLNGATKVGADGVTLELYADTGNATGTPTGTFVSTGKTTTTANGGYYLFDNLENGHYRVVIPADQFDDASDTLYGYWSSQTSRANDGVINETTAALPEINTDLDDNGMLETASANPLAGAVVSDTIILGLDKNDEPKNEHLTDVDVNAAGAIEHQGNQPDEQANMTVDFGFYTITLGDLVWDDADNSGVVNSESGIANVTVQLLSGDGSTVLASDDTDASGNYSFTGLPAGNYILRIPEAEFQGTETLRDYYSSTGAADAYEPGKNAQNDINDNDDNGTESGTNALGFNDGYIQTSVFTLTPYAEDAATSNNDTGLTNEPRIDFGVHKDPIYNLSITKSDGDGKAYYLQGGTIKYEIVVTNNGPADVSGATVTDNLPASITAASWTCAGSGAASCTASGSGNINDTINIPYGETVTYSVTATVSDTATGDIVNTATVKDPDGHTESDDHTDHESSLTVTKDDGYTVVAPGSELTYTITVTNTGDTNLTDITVTDTLPAEVDFVSASDGGSESGGVVTWTHSDLFPSTSTLLAPNAVKVVTVTVRVKADGDLGLASSITNNVTVEDDNGTTNDDDDTDTLARANLKTLLETNHPGTTDPIVAIGEILTYRVSLEVPAGVTMNNVQAVDTLDAGLAFVDCAENNPPTDGMHDLVVSSPNLASSEFTFAADGAGNLTAACNHGTNALSNNPVISPAKPAPNAGSMMTLSLGTVQNTSAKEEFVSLTYRVVVLDVDSNAGGVDDLNNLVTWTWDGGELSGTADEVELIEPDMDIEKSTETTTAPLGAIIPFTLEIYQTDISSSAAYDVVVTDVLPEGLEYVVGSVTAGAPLPYDSFEYDSVMGTLTFTWDYFPLTNGAERASTTIEFETTFVGPSPVTNEANVAWTSLPIDPILPDGSDNPDYVQSDYNDDSTERWYDPADDEGVNDYGRNSDIEIRRPALPDTGFAPNSITQLPEQTTATTYDHLESMSLEVPALGINLPIVGVPLSTNGWDLTWLGGQAGYLEGTAYPGLPGNTAITGHVYLPNGAPGPFVNLQSLQWGDKLILHANGERYIYQVRSQRLVYPSDTSILGSEAYDWITLITCQGYNETENNYAYRVAVKAVLIDTQPEE